MLHLRLALALALASVFSLAATAQTATYHLHKEASTINTGFDKLLTTGPDASSVALTTTLTNKAAGEYLIKEFETQTSVPNSPGVIPSGSTLSFSLWMRKTANVGTVFPRAKIRPNNASGTLLCTATGTTALTTTVTKQTISCNTTANISMAATDRFYLWVGVNLTATSSTSFSGEVDIEGTLNGNFDSQITLPLATGIPTITSLTPGSGTVGTSVVIAGTNYRSSQGSSTVTFNGVVATAAPWGTGSITAVVPNAATSGPVVVTVGGQSSTGKTFTVNPSITSLSVTSGTVGTSVTINGGGFGSSQGSSTVTFNGVAATATPWGTNSITAVVPNAATSGPVVVTVGGTASNAQTFTVNPNVTTLSPASGAVATSVTITGSGFGASQGSSTVSFNGVASTPTSWNIGTISVPVPAAAPIGSNTVTVTVGGTGSSKSFTVLPGITSLSPNSGRVGDSVTISGTTFGSSQGSSTVTFNGISTTPTSWSATSIVAPVPATATSGPVVVTVSGQASAGALFTVIPNIASLSVTSGTVNTLVTITGTGFGPTQGSSTVTFGGAAATPTSWSAGSISVPVPAAAISGLVVVTVGGTASNNAAFTVIPSIAGLSPAWGPANTAVTITGTGFGPSQGNSAVTFNGMAATPTSWSAGSISVPVPSGAASGPVVVTVGGTASNPVSFAVSVYGFRRAITIDHTRVSNTDQSNFPVSISGTYSYLATQANGGKVRSANGYDIIFTSDVSGTNKLDHEIESYNPTTGKVNFWVRVPALSHTTDTTIYMQYGSDTVTSSQENKTGVWDASFQAVWHLKDGTTLSGADSTSQGHNGTVNGATATTGVIDGAASFSGSSQSIDIGNMGARPTKGTLSMWVQAPTLTSFPNTFTTAGLGGGNCGMGGIRFEMSSGVYGAVTGTPCNTTGLVFTSSFTANIWHHVTLTWDSSANTETGYYDGAAAQTVIVSSWPANFDAVRIGVGWDTTRYWQGQVDEVRMSNSIRSGDWIATEYSNQNNPATFYSIGGENAVGISTSPATAVVYGGQAQQFTATVTDSTNTSVTWTISPSGTGSISSAGLYTAPAIVNSQQTVTVTATSVADGTKSGSSVVTLQPPISVSATPAAVTLAPSQAQQFTASLANTSNTAVTWSVSPAGTGNISSTGLYTAPATISTQQTVTVTATSVVDATKSGSATVTLSPASGVFTYHRPIVIDHTKIPNTDQINFPVLISGTYSYLATTANGGKAQSSNGYDIIFTTDAAGSTKLDHEIENYDPATGKVNFWVRIPSLSHTTDTVIYAQYGDAAITASLENKTGVWDSNYRGVWHLGNGSALNVLDSTSQGNNGTNNGGTASTGQIGGAALLNGSSQFIGIGSLGPVSDSSSLTLSAWAKSNSSTGIQKILAISGTTSGTTSTFVANLNESNGKFVAETGRAAVSPDDATDTGTFNTGQWYYLTGTFGVDKVTLFVNGVKKATTPYSAAGTLSLTNSNGWSVGKYVEDGTDQQWWNGSVDEVRISGSVRTPDWITAEYNNQSSPSTFYSPGAENTVVVTINPASSTLYAGQTQQFAAITMDAINPAVNWSISPSGTGSISSTGLYTAPATINTQQTVTVTATSVQDNAKSASATVTLYPPVSVSVTPASPALYSSQTQQFSAVVANAPTQSVTWSVSPAVGSVNSSGLYTAPATINAQQTVTVTAASVADPTKTGFATITLGQESQVYSNRRAITLDHTKVPNTDQSNFPVLISGTYSYLATVANGGKAQSANGYDIIFTDDAPGSTRLDHEIESYDPVTGKINFWVRIPALSHTTDTVIYLQYGNSAISTSQENKSGVWDSGYRGVWHLTGLTDSTANGFSLTNNNSAASVSGEMAGAFSFNGTNQYLSNGALSIAAGSSITISYWEFQSSARLQSSSAFNIGGSDRPNRIQAHSPWSDKTLYWDYGDDTAGGRASTDYTSYLDAWSYVTLEFDASAHVHRIFLNGVAKTSLSSSGAPASAQTGIEIGRWAAVGYQNSNLDEFRVSTVVRSADWIATEYNNQNSPSTFYSPGVENTPLIRSLSPSSGKPGTSVTIFGALFGAATGTVTFNGQAATISSWSDTSIVVIVPNGASSGPVVVTSNGGVQGNGVAFTVLAPFISGLNPNRGAAGTSVTISGSSFGATAGTVTFNGQAAATSSWSDTSIVAVVPSGAGMGNVVVTNGGMQSNGVMFGAPFISGLNPSGGLNGTSVTISGSNFGTSTASVTFAGVSAATTSWSDTSIVATVPASALSGLVIVTVQGVQSNGVSFSVQEQVVNGAVSYSYDELGRLVGVVAASGDAATYSYDAVGNILSITRIPATQPTVLSFSPTSGPVGTQVTISGSNFSANAANDTVTFNGTSATISSATVSQLVVTVPSGAATGAIAVTSPAGTATSATSFIVTSSSGKPTISSFSPTAVAGGALVTVNGTNFDLTAANDRLILNTTAVSIAPNTLSSSSLGIFTPNRVGSGRIYLSTPAGTATSSSDLFVTPQGYSVSNLAYTGRASLGSTTTVSLPNSGFGMLLFDGVAGKTVSISASSATFSNCSYQLFKPDGNPMGSSASCSTSSFLDAQTLPATGTYTVIVSPGSSSTGSVALTLNDSTNAFSSVTSGGNVTATTAVPGQNAKVTFNAVGGQQATVQLSSNTFGSVTVSLMNPDGTVLSSMTSAAASFSFPVLVLPATGMYTVLIDPPGATVGSINVGLTLQGGDTAVPLRPAGSVLDSGNPLAASLVGLFLMNESSGTTDKNLVDGQLAGFSGAALPLWRTSDPSISFQGGASLNSYLDAGADLNFDQLTPGQMTVVAKVLVRTVAAGGIAEKNDLDVDSGFVFGLDGAGALRLTVEKSQANMQVASASGTILSGQWVQLAFTWDGTTGNASSAHLFLNGVEQAKATSVDGNGTIGFANATGKPFRIGNAAFDFPGSLNGRIAYLAVYKGRILSPTELGQLDAQLPIH